MITAADLLEANGGDISPAMFPQLDTVALNTLLARYVADGYSRAPASLTDADRDRVAENWSYARANRNVLNRLSRTPANVTLDNEGSTTILSEQIRTFKEAAQRYEAQVDAILGSAPTPEESPSSSAANRYCW
jgi:hypothetical protein